MYTCIDNAKNKFSHSDDLIMQLTMKIKLINYKTLLKFWQIWYRQSSTSCY